MQNRLAGKKVNEIVLLNDHDGIGSCRMLSGMLRFIW
jgi:hypothetical protein